MLGIIQRSILISFLVICARSEAMQLQVVKNGKIVRSVRPPTDPSILGRRGPSITISVGTARGLAARRQAELTLADDLEQNTKTMIVNPSEQLSPITALKTQYVVIDDEVHSLCTNDDGERVTEKTVRAVSGSPGAENASSMSPVLGALAKDSLDQEWINVNSEDAELT